MKLLDEFLGCFEWFRKKRKGIWYRIMRTSTYDHITIVFWIRKEMGEDLARDPSFNRYDYVYIVNKIETYPC